jgi:LmbE family N-acetylglucosaminyl deacetylase
MVKDFKKGRLKQLLRIKWSRRNIFLALFFILFIIALITLSAPRLNPFIMLTPIQDMELTATDRILIMAPHPDDEVLGSGGIIQRALEMKIPVHVMFLTNGDFNEWSFLLYKKTPVLTASAVRGMGLVRHDEAIAADTYLGLSEKDLTFLGYPDFGTLPIFKSHWGNEPAYRSVLTRATSVPYSSAMSPGIPYKGENILRDITKVINDFKPTKIFISHPADWHPDHQSLYLYTKIALWDLKMEAATGVFPYLIHYKRWPRPHGYFPLEAMFPPGGLSNFQWNKFSLSSEEEKRKSVAIQYHRTQFNSDPTYLLSFMREDELFNDLPPIALYSEPIPKITELGTGSVNQTPQELTDTETASFLGFERREVRLDRNNLEITIDFSHPFAKDIGIAVYIFGYRPDKAFEEMPKIHIEFGAVEHRIFDQGNRLPMSSISVKRLPRRITMTIPLELLGNPERVLTGARSYFGEIPLDALAWRELEIYQPQ